MKPILVYYINLGNLEPKDHEHYMNKTVSKIREEDKFIQYFIPVLGQESKVECINPVYITDEQIKSDHENLMKKLNDNLRDKMNEVKIGNNGK